MEGLLLNLLAPMQLTEKDVELTLSHMLSRQILVQDGGILGMGPEGERLYGAKNFMDLLSVFDTPPVFTVFCGPQYLGTVHPLSFRRPGGEPAILSLGGRAWQVTHVDFAHKTAQVVPSEHFGRSRWLGESQPLSYNMCQAIRRILLGKGPTEVWSKRATGEIAEAIENTNCVATDALVVGVDRDEGRTTWWTFAGLLANSQLARLFTPFGSRSDNLSITINRAVLMRDFQQLLDMDAPGPEPTKFEQQDYVKFQDCLPDHLLFQLEASRSHDPQAIEATRVAGLLFRNKQ
jgi:ATP-dependent Lhr-like helicase